MSKLIYLYLTPCFPSPESWRGGFCYDAVKALMRDGRYDVRVMTSSSGEDYVYRGIRVSRFHKFAIGCSDYLPFLTEPLKIYYFSRKLRAMGLKPSDIAVCHAHLFENYAPYATWLKRRNPKCLTLLHHHWTGKHGLCHGKLDWIPGVRGLLYLYVRRHLEAADAQIFCSEISKNAFARYFPNGPLKPSVDMKEQLWFGRMFRSVRLGDNIVCYNGIDTSVFTPLPRTEASRQSVTYRIGCVGNFTPQKSQKTLIEAMEILLRTRTICEKIVVSFIGSGIRLPICRKLAAGICAKYRERVTIEFHPEIHHDDMVNFYHSLDLFVLPSYYEAFNCSFIEALGCGVPIVGCDNISIREVLSPADVSRWLFAPQDAAALAERIAVTIRERPPCQKLTRNLDIDVLTHNFLDWVDGRICKR